MGIDGSGASSISSAELEQFAQWLRDDINVVSSTLYDVKNQPIEEKPDCEYIEWIDDQYCQTSILFTFDKGKQHYLQAADILAEYNATATFFVNSGTLGSGEYLSIDELLSLQNRGFEIGGGTKDFRP